MGTKYSSNSASGFDATPPADDGTVSEANKVKWSTIKSKLATPVKDLADAINTDLGTHFDMGPTALTSNTTLGASHYNQFIQVSGSGVTLTLSDAATLGAGWFCFIRNVGSATVTIGRATGGDTINGSAANITIGPNEHGVVFVNAAATGFFTNLIAQHLDTNFTLADNSDVTKKLQLQLSGITTGTTRTLTVPDQDSTLVVQGDAASQAEQETGSSTTKYVTPGRQHLHPSAPKVWGYVTISGGTPTLAASYNVTSITDVGTGIFDVVIATDFSSANYAVIATGQHTAGGNYADVKEVAADRAAGSFRLECYTQSGGSPTLTDISGFSFVCFGDQ